jgi:hypothetical protein
MPEVFTGKVLIPGDQIDDYLAALKDAEEERAPFREMLEGLNGEFSAYVGKEVQPEDYAQAHERRRPVHCIRH